MPDTDTTTTDIEIRNEGTIFLFTPCSPAGSEFLAEHAPEDAQWFGPALVVEHRYAQDWHGYAVDAGLEVA